VDIAHYLEMELEGGRNARGEQVVSRENLLVRRTPHVKIDEHSAYGVGLEVTRDRGIEVIEHEGALVGYVSDMYFLPEHDVGVVLLVNARTEVDFARLVRQRVFEVLFDAKPRASAMLDAEVARASKRNLEQVVGIDPNPDAAWVSEVAFTYEHPTSVGSSWDPRAGAPYSTQGSGRWGWGARCALTAPRFWC